MRAEDEQKAEDNVLNAESWTDSIKPYAIPALTCHWNNPWTRPHRLISKWK